MIETLSCRESTESKHLCNVILLDSLKSNLLHWNFYDLLYCDLSLFASLTYNSSSSSFVDLLLFRLTSSSPFVRTRGWSSSTTIVRICSTTAFQMLPSSLLLLSDDVFSCQLSGHLRPIGFMSTAPFFGSGSRVSPLAMIRIGFHFASLTPNDDCVSYFACLFGFCH